MQPGGKIDANETPSQALVRELHEELDLTVGESDLAYVGHFSAPAANEKGHIVDAQVYRISHSQKLKCQAEIEEMIWYPSDKHGNVELAPLTRDFVLPVSGV